MMKNKVMLLMVFLFAVVNFVLIPTEAQENLEFGGDDCCEENSEFVLEHGVTLISSYESDSVASYPTTNVYTPNGSTIVVKLKDEVFDEELAEFYDQFLNGEYSNGFLIYRSTSVFNCHSYAWYSQNYQTNIYWMDDPKNYVTDRSYWLVSQPEPGDIIVYVSSDGNILHSGIVVEVHDGESNDVCGDSNLVTVQSKWGENGLYEHRGDECPYTVSAHDYDTLDAEIKKFRIADTVLYFRRDSLNHTHTFAKTTHNSDRHKKYCTGCGVTIWEEHDYSTVVSKNSNGHTVRCACGDSVTLSHSFDYQTYSEHHHKKYCDCGYITYVAHNYEYSYTNDQTHTKVCTLCDASYQGSHYEAIYSVEDNGDGTHDIMCICEWVFDEAENHTYTEYDYYNDVYHMISCICGDYELVEHDLFYEDCGDYHWEVCEICGYEAEVEHSFTESKSYYNMDKHEAFCACGAHELVPHDQYTETSHNNLYHTLQLTCCGSRTVTFAHHFDEYDEDSHTGPCSFCSYTVTADLAHVIPYGNIGGGKHSGTCNWCDYTHTEPHTYMYTPLGYSDHQIECEKCDDYQVVADHTWDEYYDEDDNLITYCTGCGYVAGTEPLTADMIAKLSAELQTEIQSAPQNAQLNAQPDGDIYYVIRIDDETGILYFNGEYYLLHSPEIPDAETEPIPPSEESIS